MGSSSKKCPSKKKNPLAEARECLAKGLYTATYHAGQRQIERLVPLPDVMAAIESGHHEKSRDRFDEPHQEWSYSIRGKATDKRELRVVISFDTDGLLIITVVVLKGSQK